MTAPIIEPLEARIAPATLTIAPIAHPEGNADGSFAFDAQLDSPAESDVTFHYSTADGTASAGTDYETVSDAVGTIPAGSTSVQVFVTVHGNTTPEHDRDFHLLVSNVTGASLGSNNDVLGTILDDDQTISIASKSTLEGNSGTTPLNFTVSLSGAADHAITFDARTIDGTAVSSPASAADFDALAQTFTIPAGATSVLVPVTIHGDTQYGGDETFQVQLSNVFGATLGSAATATGTILNDDTVPPTLAISSASVNEGDAANPTHPLNFTVSLSAPADGDVTFTATTTDASAVSTGTSPDFDAISQSFTIHAGDTSVVVPVGVHGNTAVDGDRAFHLTISNPHGANLSSSTDATGTILDDDQTLSIASNSIAEGDTGTKSLNFTVSLGAPAQHDVTFVANTFDGTATSSGTNADYDTVSQTFTIHAGDSSVLVPVTIHGDTLYGPDETFKVQLSNASGAKIGGLNVNTATGTIINDDTNAPSVSIAGPAQHVAEGSNATFSISLSSPVDSDLTVAYHLGSSGDTATSSDYTTPSPSTVVVHAGATSATFNVPVVHDNVGEPDETFTAVLDSATFGTDTHSLAFGASSAVATIAGDPALHVHVGDVSVTEGDSGITTAVFAVSLDTPAPAGGIVLHYHTVDGTATSSGTFRDFTPAGDTALNFAAGDLTKTFTIGVIGDHLAEANETFSIVLDKATAAGVPQNLLGGNATGTIVTDDPMAVSATLVTHDVVGAANHPTFSVALSSPMGYDVSVAYTTGLDGGAAGAGHAIVIPAGSTSVDLPVDYSVDATSDHLEHATLTGIAYSGVTFAAGVTPPTLSLASGQSAGDAHIWSDRAVSVTFGQPNATQVEGNSGTSNFNFTVAIPTAADHDIVVAYHTADGTAVSGGTFADYNPVSSGAVTILKGATSATIPIAVKGDTLAGPDETFSVIVGSATGGTPDSNHASAQATIANDDGTPSVSIASTSSALHGGNATFNVTLSAAAENPVTVYYSTADGTAVAGTDYTAATSHAVTIAPGQTTASISVPVLAEASPNATPAETFSVNLSLKDSSGATTSPFVTLDQSHASGLATIAATNLPTVSIGDITHWEGTSTSTPQPFDFTVTLSKAVAQDVTFTYQTVDGAGISGAHAGSDYTAVTNGTGTIPAGSTTATVEVMVTGDDTAEPNETFSVALAGATLNFSNSDHTSLGLTKAAGTATIEDSSSSFSLANSSIVVTEGVDKTAVFTINRTGDASQSATVSFNTVEGTAKAISDFSARSGTVVFPPGATQETVSIPIIDDNHHEATESFGVALTSVSRGSFADGTNHPTALSGTVTVNDNDAVPHFTVSSPSVVEGGSQKTLDFVVTLERPNDAASITLNYATADGTATSASGGTQGPLGDYVATSGSIVFAPGTLTKTISVPVNDDHVVDSAADETVLVNFSVDPSSTGQVTLTPTAGSGATVQSATGHIIDNEVEMASVSSTAIYEGQDAVFTISLAHPSQNTVKVNYATVDGTAVSTGSGADFQPLPLTGVTFAPGETTKQVVVHTNDDAIAERDESFSLQLSLPATGAYTILSPSGGIAVGTIHDNDHASLTVNDVTVLEGNVGDHHVATFTVSLSQQTADPVTVKYGTVNGTATGGVDYTAIAGTLTFTPGGSLTQTVSVPITGNNLQNVLPSEAFTLQLSGASDNVTIAKTSGTGTILDDDTTPTLNLVYVAGSTATGDAHGVVEGGKGTTTTMTFRAQLTSAASSDVTFNIFTAIPPQLHNAATPGVDYVAGSQSITIAKGSVQSAPFTVTVNGDNIFEPTEAVQVRIAGVTGANAGNSVATGLIYNDDVFVSPHVVKWTDVDGDLVTLTTSQGSLLNAGFSWVTATTNGVTDTKISPVGGRQLQELDLFSHAGQTFLRANISIVATAQPGMPAGSGDGLVNVGTIRSNNLVGFSNALEAKGVDLGNVTVDGDLNQIFVGDLFRDAALKTLNVHSLGTHPGTAAVAGTGAATSVILGGAGAIKVAGDVSGHIEVIGQDTGRIGTLSIGGALRGTAEVQSGDINLTAGIGTATIGSIIGGSGIDSGNIAAQASIGSLKVLHNIDNTGGAGYDASSGTDTAEISAFNIGKTAIGGSILGGSIRATGAIAAITVAGNLTGNSGTVGSVPNGEHAVIAAEGIGAKVALPSVIVAGSTDGAQILAGYGNSGGVLSALNGSVQIGTVHISGDVHATDIVAGAVGGTGGSFGTTADVAISGRSNNTVSDIAQVIIDGQVSADSIAHGIVAHQVDAVSVGGVTVPLDATENRALLVGAGSNFFVDEVP